MTTILQPGDVGRRFVHQQIADAAKGLAGEFWDQMCSGTRVHGKLTRETQKRANDFRRAWPDRQFFIDARWMEFIEAARGALIALLNKPMLAEHLKEQINEALRLDQLVNPKRLSPEAEMAQKQQAPKR